LEVVLKNPNCTNASAMESPLVSGATMIPQIWWNLHVKGWIWWVLLLNPAKEILRTDKLYNLNLDSIAKILPWDKRFA
jgi:hypothetical protein